MDKKSKKKEDIKKLEAAKQKPDVSLTLFSDCIML
jgi:hypothetical protein